MQAGSLSMASAIAGPATPTVREQLRRLYRHSVPENPPAGLRLVQAAFRDTPPLLAERATRRPGSPRTGTSQVGRARATLAAPDTRPTVRAAPCGPRMRGRVMDV